MYLFATGPFILVSIISLVRPVWSLGAVSRVNLQSIPRSHCRKISTSWQFAAVHAKVPRRFFSWRAMSADGKPSVGLLASSLYSCLTSRSTSCQVDNGVLVLTEGNGTSGWYSDLGSRMKHSHGVRGGESDINVVVHFFYILSTLSFDSRGSTRFTNCYAVFPSRYVMGAEAISRSG